jgi:hypothetical protein
MLKPYSGSDRVILEFFFLIRETCGYDITALLCASFPVSAQRLNFYGYFATGGN